MATLDQLLAKQQELSDQILELGRAIRNAPTQAEADSLATERQQLQNQRAVLDVEIEQLAPNIPSQAEYLGLDDQTGGYFYRNLATGNRFISLAPPTAAQQSTFDANNPSTGTNSAGAEVAQEQEARTENANTQNPEPDLTESTPANTNADTTAGTAPPAVAPPPPKLPGTTGNVSPPDTTAPTTTLPGTPIPLAGRDLISVVGGSEASQSYIYRATTVTHMFSKGMFTQQLEGALVIYDIPPQSAPAASDQSDAETARLNRQNAAAAVPDQSDAETARLNRQNAAANTANVNPSSVSTPQTPPPAAAESSQASITLPPSTAAPETVAPAETTPPTSGSEDVSVTVNTTPPPTTIEFAGATLTASLQVSGRVFIQLTLPSGATEINVDGWGDAQWDSLLSSTTNAADIAAINSLKASWSGLQSQLRQSVTAPASVTNATPQNMAKEA
jgi:hypothetical protein